MAKIGRPDGFKHEFLEQAEKLCQLGATDEELANFFNVAVRTIYRWAARIPEFSQALKQGKDSADERVVRSLYHRAVGYTFDAVKIFQVAGQPLIVPYKEHVPPDTTAGIFWLKNRRKDEWRDRREVEVGGPGDFERMSDGELAEYVKTQAAELGGSGDGTGEAPKTTRH